MLDLNQSAFKTFVESNLDDDLKQIETAIKGVEFKSRKHGFKALCILLGVNTQEDLDEKSILINTVLKHRGLGKEA